MKAWILARLRERSTWAGLVGLLGAAGIAITPEQSEAILAAVMAIVGLFAVVTPTTQR
jgi:hypothetical protein